MQLIPNTGKQDAMRIGPRKFGSDTSEIVKYM